MRVHKLKKKLFIQLHRMLKKLCRCFHFCKRVILISIADTCVIVWFYILEVDTIYIFKKGSLLTVLYVLCK